MPEEKKQTRTEFIAYLRETLVPDLRAMGSTATAKDFETGITFMETQLEAARRKFNWQGNEQGTFSNVYGESVHEVRVHYCVTGTGYFGRGLSIDEAVNACKAAGAKLNDIRKHGYVYRLPVGVTHAGFNGSVGGVTFFNRDNGGSDGFDVLRFDRNAGTLGDWVLQ